MYIIINDGKPPNMLILKSFKVKVLVAENTCIPSSKADKTTRQKKIIKKNNESSLS